MSDQPTPQEEQDNDDELSLYGWTFIISKPSEETLKYFDPDFRISVNAETLTIAKRKVKKLKLPISMKELSILDITELEVGDEPDGDDDDDDKDDDDLPPKPGRTNIVIDPDNPMKGI